MRIAERAVPGPTAARAGGARGRPLDDDLAEHVLGMAVGLLVARRHCTPRRALGVLVDRSTRTGRSVTDEALRLVSPRRPRPPAGRAA